MSWRDFVRRCRSHDPERYSVLHVAGHPAGRVPKALAPRLESAAPGLLGPCGDGWCLRAAGAQTTAEALELLARRLAAAGLTPPCTGELYEVRALDSGRRLGAIDRSAATLLGLRTQGVHLNGTTTAADGTVRMWLARRSMTCASFPGKLDNLAAGGVADGASPEAALRQEALTEAGIGAVEIEAARPAGRLSYLADTGAGLVDVEMTVFDLDLPASFIPENRDGSVAGFLLVALDQAERLALVDGAFKDNCSLVLFDYLVRHGRAASVTLP